jgi:hypothetical protein
MSATSAGTEASVDLLWVPLGAGTALPTVRWCGRLYEAAAARHSRRQPRPIFHAALEIVLDTATYAVEMAPAWGASSRREGVVGRGPVGLRWLGRSRFFQYEVRRWQDGVIPDRDEAVGGATTVCTDVERTRRALVAVADFPTATWGRDELGVGDMWNSNSLAAFVLVRAGVDVRDLSPPDEGRAPGWIAGAMAAGR